jgi:hypothetical protein
MITVVCYYPSPNPLPARLCHDERGHCSDQRKHGNLIFLMCYEIASVVILPRNDVMTRVMKGKGQVKKMQNLFC